MKSCMEYQEMFIYRLSMSNLGKDACLSISIFLGVFWREIGHQNSKTWPTAWTYWVNCYLEIFRPAPPFTVKQSFINIKCIYICLKLWYLVTIHIAITLTLMICSVLVEHWIRAKYYWKEFHAETTQIPAYLKGNLLSPAAN